jgi:hypothetical protein
VRINGEEYYISVSYTDATEEFSILGARHSIGENYISDRYLYLLQPGDVIEPRFYVLDTDDSTYSLQTVGTSITVSAETSLDLKELPDGDYLFMFTMRDYQHNTYASDAAVIEVEGDSISVLD